MVFNRFISSMKPSELVWFSIRLYTKGSDNSLSQSGRHSGFTWSIIFMMVASSGEYIPGNGL